MRKLSDIAHEALQDPTLKGNAREWATPYLRALLFCAKASDPYLLEGAGMQVKYALANLHPWRGASAQRIKKELLAHVS